MKTYIKNQKSTSVSTSNQFEDYMDQIEKSNIDITTDFETWKNLGIAISTEFGEAGRKYYHQISKCNKQYDSDICNAQYNKCLLDKSTGINISTFYKIAEKYGIKPSVHNEKAVLKVVKKTTELEHLEYSIPIIKHSSILSELLKQFQPIDFEKIANPGALDNFKLTTKHFCVISIDNVLETAKSNNWDLCRNQSYIYVFNGAFWEEIDKDTFQKFLSEAAKIMGVPSNTAKYHLFHKDLHHQFMATAYLEPAPSSAEKVLINLKNGTFEISSEGTQLRVYDPKDFMTYQLPFEND